MKIGNGLVNKEADMRGFFYYLWSHVLISFETHQGLHQNCFVNGPLTVACQHYQNLIGKEMRDIYISSIISDPCSMSGPTKKVKLQGKLDPCVQKYINLPEVQNTIHAINTKMPRPWSVRSKLKLVRQP